jgi:putative oxidoreductase
MLSRFAPITASLNRMGDAALPLLARLVFAGVLLHYFWASGLTKLGNGIFGVLHPSSNAYVQVFPKVMEAANYDTAQLGLYHWAVVTGVRSRNSSCLC